MKIKFISWLTEQIGLRLRNVKLGKNSYSNSRFLWNVVCGDNVRIAPRVYARGKGIDFFGDPYDSQIVIGNNVRIGYNVFITPGVRIGDNSIVGALSVVTHDIPNNEVWAGNPAKKINDR